MRKANLRVHDASRKVVPVLQATPNVIKPTIFFRKMMKYAFSISPTEPKPILMNVDFKKLAYRLIPTLLSQWNNKPYLLPRLVNDHQVMFHDKELVKTDFKVDGTKIRPFKNGRLLHLPRYQFVWSRSKQWYRLKTDETIASVKDFTHYLIVSEITEKEGERIKLVNYGYQTGTIAQKKKIHFIDKKAPEGHDWHQDLKHLIKSS